jgi:6-phosphogluconolactonase
MNSLEIKIFDTADELRNFAADYILNAISETITVRNKCSISLSGGTTPRKIYELLAEKAKKKDVEWKSVHFFWGDERCVPSDDEQSNYLMVKKSLLSSIDIPSENIHRIKVEMEPDESAFEYEAEIKRSFSTESIPRFDLMLLGLGDDTHTASLFPFSAALKEERRWAVPASKENGQNRVTLTLPVINSSATTIFIVSGKNKAEAVYRVFFNSFEPDKYPAQSVKPESGNLFWFMDRSAASLYLENKNIV